MRNHMDTTIGFEDALEKFPEFPKRADMQHSIHIYQTDVISILTVYFGNEETTLVAARAPVAPSAKALDDVRIPDLMVSFNCDYTLFHKQQGYAIDRQSKPPEFVLEVAYHGGGIEDESTKRKDYQRYGVSEYWRLDPSMAEQGDVPLAADMLMEESYRPVDVQLLGPDYWRGYSEALGLYICWDEGRLRFYDRNAGEHLLNHLEVIALTDKATALAEQETVDREKYEAEVRRLQSQLNALRKNQ